MASSVRRQVVCAVQVSHVDIYVECLLTYSQQEKQDISPLRSLACQYSSCLPSSRKAHDVNMNQAILAGIAYSSRLFSFHCLHHLVALEQRRPKHFAHLESDVWTAKKWSLNAQARFTAKIRFLELCKLRSSCALDLRPLAILSPVLLSYGFAGALRVPHMKFSFSSLSNSGFSS